MNSKEFSRIYVDLLISGFIARQHSHLYTTRALQIGGRLIPFKVPFRTSFSDLGARIGITERSVPLAFRIVAVQGVLAAMLTMTLLMLGRAYAVSALAAGVVVIAPSFIFAWRIVRTHASPGEELGVARRLMVGGVAKLLATVGLLVVAFVYVRPEPVAFFATMIALQAVYWFAPMLDPDASHRIGETSDKETR